MSVDFSAYLGKAVGDIQAPKALPEGHYYARIKDHTPKESGSGKPMLVTTFVIDSAADDVDQSALPSNGVANRTLRTNFMLDADFGVFQIKEMLTACGIEMDDAQGIGTYLPASLGLPVKLYVTARKMDPQDPASREIEDVKKVLAAS